MNRVFVIALIFLLIAGFSSLSFAGGDTATQSSDVAAYRLQVGNKFERGGKNILFGWTELPKRIVDITKESNNPIWGVLAGTFQGTLKAFARTASGVCDVATAPIKPADASFVNPDINVE